VTVTPELFREVLGRLAGGATIVTSVDPEGGAAGFTATAVCAVSLSPPLVLVCVGQESTTHAAIHASRRYALNFLAAGSRDLCDRFATSSSGKFDGVQWTKGGTGCPLLNEAMAACECEVVNEVAAGDHTVFVGRVEYAYLPSDPAGEAVPPALVHYAGSYSVASPTDEAAR
jgi:flavin reductase (DIM6/NTAB) family NADH-FMN oxidoreductase RutF